MRSVDEKKRLSSADLPKKHRRLKQIKRHALGAAGQEKGKWRAAAPRNSYNDEEKKRLHSKLGICRLEEE